MPEVFNLPVHSLSPIYCLISLPVSVFTWKVYLLAKIAKRLSAFHPLTMMEFPLPAGGVSVPKYHLRVVPRTTYDSLYFKYQNQKLGFVM